VNELLLTSLGDLSLEEALIPVPIHQELPLECLLEAGKHEVYGWLLIIGNPLAKVLRGDRQSNRGPGNLEGRPWLGCRHLNRLVGEHGRVKGRHLTIGDQWSWNRVGGNDSA
jgi:hypothetical protein